MSKIEDEIKLSQSTIKAMQKKLAEIENIKNLFPDVEVFTDRWQKKYYKSKSVNAIVDQWDYHASCGCCPDAAIYYRAYIEFNGINIYSDPVQMYVGNQSYSHYDKIDPTKNWKENIEKYGLNKKIEEEIIKSVERRINIPYEYEEDDAE